jgi:hypothetical protein
VALPRNLEVLLRFDRFRIDPPRLLEVVHCGVPLASRTERDAGFLVRLVAATIHGVEG